MTLSRREFLKIAGIALGGTTLIGSGVGYLVTRVPEHETLEVETPKFTYGKENSMNNRRLLITYATRTGSTVGVASAIGEVLGKRGYAVDVKPVKENPSVEGYSAVLVGSAVNGAQWLPEAVEYVKVQQKTLSHVPVALFCVHIMNLGDDQKSRDNRLAYLNSVRPLVNPVAEAYFAGMGMDPAKESWLTRWAYRTFHIGPEGDCRDWGKIRSWADSVNV